MDRVDDSPELHSRDEVEISGVTSSGLFAPVVIAQHITILGKQALPPAHLYHFAELAGGREDSQWLAITGIVRSAEVKRSWGRSVLFLNIDVGGGSIVTARVHDFSQALVDRLPASTVIVTGVCGTVFNDRRQFIGIRVFVSNLDSVKVVKPAPVEPFDVPLRPLGGLLQFDQREGAIDQVKVRGTVTYSEAGHGFYLQEGSQGVFVQSGQTTPVTIGTQLEAVGYPAAGRYSPVLDNAVFRVLGQARPPDPEIKSASDIIVIKDGFLSAPYDSALVQVEGRLIEEIPSVDEDRLLLQEGTTVFTARLPGSNQGRNFLTAGSLISVTGVCSAIADETHELRSFEILLRSPTDILVTRKAPWWSAAHAGWVVVVLIITVLGMFVWLAVIRRQANLRELAVTDPLTGLYNRRGFLLLAEQQWKLALRGEHHFLLFYIDVDEFKKINDTFGHREGDQALRIVADLLRQCFRKADIIGRLGGDEFAVTAIEASEPSGATLEQRISTAVTLSNAKKEKPFQLSLSVGILACDSTLGPIPIEDLLARADALMYLQKRSRAVPELARRSGSTS